jgi:hypothetical protein
MLPDRFVQIRALGVTERRLGSADIDLILGICGGRGGAGYLSLAVQGAKHKGRSRETNNVAIHHAFR